MSGPFTLTISLSGPYTDRGRVLITVYFVCFYIRERFTGGVASYASGKKVFNYLPRILDK